MPMLVEDIRTFLLDRAAACEAGGVKRERIALDPGIGFGKSVAQELELIAGAGRFADAGYPVLIGCSRKSFIGKLTGLRGRCRSRSGVGMASRRSRAARRGDRACPQCHGNPPGPRGLGGNEVD